MTASILIVGAGPVGLATAALLRQQGIASHVIERSASPTTFSKAVGIHARTLESMHALGLTEELISDGHPLHQFALHQGGRSIMKAGFSHIDSPYPFVLGLPQSRTECRLLARLEELGGSVEWDTQLETLETVGDAEGALAQVLIRTSAGKVERRQYRWVIGADGGRSTVREQAGIAFPGGDYGHAFILGDVRVDWDGPKHQLQFFLSPHGYLLLVPMPDGLHRVIAQTSHRYEDFQGKDRPLATLEQLQAIVSRNGPPGMRVHSPQWVTSAPFYHRMAETPWKGRVLLVGDAYHLYSPLGAQGLNTGLQDAFNLAWKLAFVEKGWSDLRLLESYRDERNAIAGLISKVTTKTTRFITATAPHLRWLRAWASRWYNSTASVQNVLPRLLAGEMQSYGVHAFLSDRAAPLADRGTPVTGPGLPVPGARIRHAWIPSAAGGSAYRPLASLLHGTRYTLLALVERITPACTRLLAQSWTEERRAQYPFLQVLVIAREIGAHTPGLPTGITLQEDRLGAVFKAFGQPAQALVLARPDGFAALASDGWAFESVFGYFDARNLGAGASNIRPADRPSPIFRVKLNQDSSHVL